MGWTIEADQARAIDGKEDGQLLHTTSWMN